MDKNTFFKQLFARFLQGECDEHEVQMIIDYLQHDPDAAILPDFEEVEERIHHLQQLDARKSEEIFSRISFPESSTKVASQISLYKPWLKVAASVSVILLVSLFTYLYFPSANAEVYATGFGETREISLKDGSRVTLNANSELRLSQPWEADKDRLVQLKGEAFFEVSHTPDHQRFIVETDEQLRIIVLGTEFNVNSRRDEAQVVLFSGKVKVDLPLLKEDVEMQPGEMLDYKKGQQWKKEAVDATLYSAWTQNMLIFRDSRLEEVAKVLEINFGYEVIFENDSLARLSFTGTNPADDPELLISTLEKSFNLLIKQEGKKLSIQAP